MILIINICINSSLDLTKITRLRNGGVNLLFLVYFYYYNYHFVIVFTL